MDVDLLPGQPFSIWRASTSSSPRPPLRDFERFDVLIIGGGIVGICTAYQLRNSGMKVGLCEAGTLLNDVTGNTTGKLTTQHGVKYRQLIDHFGKTQAQSYVDANEWAIRWVRETADNQGIRCDYVQDAAHIYATEMKLSNDFQNEFDACSELGLPVTLLEKPDLPFETTGAIRMEKQARFHPLKFLLPLADIAESAGTRIFENTRVLEVEEEENFCRVKTEYGPVIANRVVIATNYPIHDSGLFVARLAPYRSYAMAVEVAGHMPRGMFITHDKEEVFRSLRRQWVGDRELLIVGGENHKVGQHDDMAKCYLNIEHWTRLHFDVQKIHFRWSTQDNWTPDGLPYIGLSPNRKRIHLATGFFGWGMTNGVVAGKLIRDQILGLESPWTDVYNPSRMGLSAVPKLVSENVNTAAHLLGDRIKRAPEKQLDDIMPGDASVIQFEDERLAVYRDETSQLHACTSACTHMGCQVHWNSAERSWDCPCHGSRFGVDGSVLHGPAVKPLEKRDVSKMAQETPTAELSAAEWPDGPYLGD